MLHARSAIDRRRLLSLLETVWQVAVQGHGHCKGQRLPLLCDGLRRELGHPGAAEVAGVVRAAAVQQAAAHDHLHPRTAILSHPEQQPGAASASTPLHHVAGQVTACRAAEPQSPANYDAKFKN